MDDYNVYFDLGWNAARTDTFTSEYEILNWNSYQLVGFGDGVRSYYAEHRR